MPASILLPETRDLQPLNTLSLRAFAQDVVRITQAEDIPQLAPLASQAGGLFVLGAGSNVVLPERMGGLVACMAIKGVRIVDRTADAVLIEAGAGEVWHDFVSSCVGQGLAGLENLALIPGTVGAAPVQNIGAYGVEVRERIHSVTAFSMSTQEWVTMSAAECRFAYRDSFFKREPQGAWVIASVTFSLPTQWTPVLDYPDLQRRPELQGSGVSPRAIFDAVCDIRRSKLPDPAELPNAGSFFKNPVVQADVHAALSRQYPGLPGWPQPGGGVKVPAAWLIDRCGWKGRRLGQVGMHDRHALVLVNHGGACAADVAALAQAVQQDVRKQFGVWLEPEPVAPFAALEPTARL